LIYIGIGSLRASGHDANIRVINQIAKETLSKRTAFFRGFLTNVLNAKAAFFTISIFTVLVSPQTPLYVQLIYGAFIQLSTIAWFSIVAIFLTNPAIQGRFLSMKPWIERACGAILIALGIRLCVSDIAQIAVE